MSVDDSKLWEFIGILRIHCLGDSFTRAGICLAPERLFLAAVDSSGPVVEAADFS